MDHENGKGLTITIWEDEEAMRRQRGVPLTKPVADLLRHGCQGDNGKV
jgi:hypothetical protein